MSVEEDIELKNLVAQTLENKGILPKIRAELRANVFLALEENPNTKDTLLKNDELSAFLKIPIGTLVLNLIREFLEFFELEFTLSVFEPETKYGKEYNGITRDKMINELKIADSSKKNPLLFDVIDKVVNINKLEVSKGGKASKDSKPGFNCIPQNGEGDLLMSSPGALNSTYVKKVDGDSIILSPIDKHSKDDTNESIKEEVLSNNFSEADTSSEVQLDLGNISKAEPEEQSGQNPSDNKFNEVNLSSATAAPRETLEIDLLTFTPVKDTKGKEKPKLMTVNEITEKKTDENRDVSKSFSVLGDLPPLNTQLDEKDFDMKDLKSIIDGWSDEKNLPNNDESGEAINVTEPDEIGVQLVKQKSVSSGKSQRSDITDGDFEDDTSDILSSRTSMDTPVTVDETLSKASCAADYLESL